MAFVALGIAILTNALANLFIKLSAQAGGNAATLLASFRHGQFWIGVALFGVTLAAYNVALQRFALSVAYPIFAVGALAVIVLLSLFVLHERLTLNQYLGFFFTLLAVFFLSRR